MPGATLGYLALSRLLPLGIADKGLMRSASQIIAHEVTKRIGHTANLLGWSWPVRS